MATLSVSKTYSDDTLLSAADLEAIVSSVETFVNTTRLNNDNIQNDSIVGSQKLKTASVTTAVIADEAVGSSKLANSSITTAKLAADSISAAKIQAGTLVRRNFYALAPLADAGTTVLFHTFNGTVSIPRGWMPCNGDLITETNYNNIHGSGSFAADKVEQSDLWGKYLPNMINKYAIGVAATTHDGETAFSSVGAPSNVYDFSHTHSLNSHVHGKGTRGGALEIGVGSTSSRRIHTDEPAQTSTPVDVTVSTELESINVQPESIEFIYIMKVV